MAWIYKVGTIQTVTMSESERRNNATEFYNYFIQILNYIRIINLKERFKEKLELRDIL